MNEYIENYNKVEISKQPTYIREGKALAPPLFDSFDKMGQICNICGRDVSLGSGHFVDRVQDFNDIITRINIGRQFPLGNFVCRDCDEIEE